MAWGLPRLSAPFARLPRSLAKAAGLATTRFPIAAVLVMVFSLVSNLEVADFELWPDWPRLLSALAGAAAASVAMRVGAETRLRPASLWLVVLPALAAAIVGTALWFGQPLALYAPALLPAALFAIPLAPFAGRGNDRQFWTFTLWAGVGVTLAFLSVMVFAAGLTAILEMIRFLFDVGPGSQAYEHIFVTAVTLVGPLFALGRIPAVSEEELVFSRDDRLVAAVRPLFDWVAAPLVLATALVLHVYALRILVTGEVPVGEVGWIVTFFTLLVLGLRIAIDPFLEDGARPARIFGRLWAAFLVVPLALLAYAAWLRVGAHGFTIDRYFLVLGGIAGTLALAIQLLPRGRGDIRILAAIPTILLALSVAGPWSAANVVGRSQTALIAAEFRNDAGLLATDGLAEAGRRALRSRIVELGEVEQLWRLAPMIASEEVRSLALDSRGEDGADVLAAALGLAGPYWPIESERSFAGSPEREMAIGGYDVAAFARGVGVDESGGTAGTPNGITLHFEMSDLVVGYRGTADRVDLTAALAGLDPAIFQPDLEIEPPVFDVVSNGGRALRLRFEHLSLDADNRPTGALLTVLLRAAEWPPASLGGG